MPAGGGVPREPGGEHATIQCRPRNPCGADHYEVPKDHGEPVHIGDPSVIGISDLSKPDYGEPVTIREGDVPVFWACSVTPQSIATSVKLPFMITQSPGHMMITDIRDDEITVL